MKMFPFRSKGFRGIGIATALSLYAIILTAWAPSLPGRVEEPSAAPDQEETYEVQRGDTAEGIARLYYGSEHYGHLLLLHNNLEWPEDLLAGAVISVPGFEGLFAGEAVSEIYGCELKLVLQAREKFLSMEKQLWDIHSADWKQNPVVLPEDVKSALEQAEANVDKAIAGFGELRDGVVYEPRGLLGQLKSLSSNLHELSLGANDGYGYDLDMVHQRLALALTYAVKWSRAGFR